jgi:TIR domain-containing protein/SIR2-like protein
MPFANWNKLLYGIERGECILFLGPDLPVDAPGAPRQVPAQSLAARLLAALGDDGRGGLDPASSDLAWIAQRFVAREDELALEMHLGEWHREWLERASPLHDALAELPLRLIVTCGLDPLMETALRRAGKTPSVERYHYRGRNEELLPEASVDAPLLFHLYGRVDEPPSVVLTELQLLDFLAHLISHDPPLPNDLNAGLTHGRLFLFLGFGLRQWYLRILFHVLKVLRPDSRGFAVEAIAAGVSDQKTKGDHAIFFYRDNFKMELVDSDPIEFVRELRDRYVQAGGPARMAKPGSESSTTTSGPGRGPTVFICHASEDKKKASEIHDALKKARLEPWLDQDALRGGDRWDDLIAATIEKVDYFVVLNSKALVAKSREASYVNKEIKRALQADDLRLVGHFIVPASIDDAPLLEPLAKFHAVDLRKPEGLSELVRAIKRQSAAG